MTVEEVIDRRGITEVLHFTTNQGLLGMLASGGILSRERLPKEKYLEHVYKPNAPVRHDSNWLDYVNLSITTINTEFFGHSSRWRQDQEVWWCVVSLDPAVLRTTASCSRRRTTFTRAYSAPPAPGDWRRCSQNGSPASRAFCRPGGRGSAP